MSANPSWKADGSFKGGFKNKLEEKMNEKFPGCGLKVVPHIESKIEWFKDKYNVLTEMFRTSGFSWDNEKHMIICERQSYEDFYRDYGMFLFRSINSWQSFLASIEQLEYNLRLLSKLLTIKRRRLLN
ncbi:Polyphosphate:ADP phosphotransferase [Bienertia sinuspersici]